MNYIVFDLEWNAIKYKTNKPQEIIEIGAVKIDSNDFSNIDYFSSLIKPKENISKFTEKLTGINDEEVENSLLFPDVINQFKKFIGNENYCLVSWGKEDIRFLKQDCERYNVDCLKTDNSIDIQWIIFNIYEKTFKDTPGLQLALEKFDIESDGDNHRALDDAINTTKVFTKVAKEYDVHKEYRRKTSGYTLFFEGEINKKGQKHMKRWIKLVMKKQDNINLTWTEFTSDEEWNKIIEDYDLNKKMIYIIKRNYRKTRNSVRRKLSKEN